MYICIFACSNLISNCILMDGWISYRFINMIRCAYVKLDEMRLYVCSSRSRNNFPISGIICINNEAQNYQNIHTDKHIRYTISKKNRPKLDTRINTYICTFDKYVHTYIHTLNINNNLTFTKSDCLEMYVLICLAWLGSKYIHSHHSVLGNIRKFCKLTNFYKILQIFWGKISPQFFQIKGVYLVCTIIYSTKIYGYYLILLV